VDFSCFGYHPDLESRLTFQEKWVLAGLERKLHGFGAADEAGDEATADLYTQRLAAHEKHAWMIRSTLGKK